MPNWTGNKKISYYYEKIWPSFFVLLLVIILDFFPPFRQTLDQVLSVNIGFSLAMDIVFLSLILIAILNIIRGLVSYYQKEGINQNSKQTLIVKKAYDVEKDEKEINNGLDSAIENYRTLRSTKEQLNENYSHLKSKVEEKTSKLELEIKDLESELNKINSLLNQNNYES